MINGYRDQLDERLGVMNYLGALTTEELAGVALLVLSNRLVREWAQWLKAARFSARRLDEYEGLPIAGIKVGTYARSKGLEFTRVILPGLTADGVPSVDMEDADSFFLQARQLYVAMGRARDELWMSYSGKPSVLIEDLVKHYRSVVDEGPIE
jgi:superfamily I DNA/RNA helicase